MSAPIRNSAVEAATPCVTDTDLVTSPLIYSVQGLALEADIWYHVVVVYDDAHGRIVWNGEVPSWGMSTIVFAVTVTEERVINNTATIDDGLGKLTERGATTRVSAYDVYLPIVFPCEEPCPVLRE